MRMANLVRHDDPGKQEKEKEWKEKRSNCSFGKGKLSGVDGVTSSGWLLAWVGVEKKKVKLRGVMV